MQIKQIIRNYLLKSLLNAVVAEQVARVSKDDKLLIEGKEITLDEAQSLLAEVQFIKETRFWAICQNTLKEQAQKSIFDNAKVYDDIVWGKALLYNLDLQLRIMEIIKGYKVN
jgi:hypothetical protein